MVILRERDKERKGIGTGIGCMFRLMLKCVLIYSIQKISFTRILIYTNWFRLITQFE